MAGRKPSMNIISRELEVKGIISARVNHVDPRIVTLVTFLPYKVNYGKDHKEFSKQENVPVIIIRTKKGILFDYITKENQVFKIMGKKYQISGYPQPTDTMMSIEAFVKLFGKNPQPKIPKPVSVIPEIDPAELLFDIEKQIYKYIGFFNAEGKLDKKMYWLVAMWIMQTYIYDVWGKTSYLKIMGTFDSGKSTFSELTELLTFCSERSTAKVSDSWFYRNTHCTGGTQCVDEVEINKKNRSDFLNLLKAGWKKGATIHLSDNREHNKSEDFHVYSPKLVAGTEVQNIDPILSSRMIEITMRTAPPGYHYDSEALETEEVKKELQSIRDRLYYFRLLHAHEYLIEKTKIKSGSIGRLDKEGKDILRNRQLDLYAPILTMAKLYGGKGIVKDLIAAIKEQIEIKKAGTFETYDMPIIQIIFEATRPVRQCELSAWTISKQVVDKYAGDDVVRRRYLTNRYDTDIVEKRLKGLGMARETKITGNGIIHLFAKEDIDRYILNRGLKSMFDKPSQVKFLSNILKAMNHLQRNNQDYWERGIPVDEIHEELGYDPQIFLYQMLNNPRPPVEEKRPGRWLALIDVERV